MKTVQIKGPIVSDDTATLYRWFGLSACSPEGVRQALSEAGGEEVTLEINSPGGVCVSAYEIYTALRKYEGRIRAEVICAMSAATLIACAADETYISQTGIYMIHNARISGAEGSSRDMEEHADALRQFDEGIINAYIQKTGKGRDEIAELMEHNTYMGPQRAVELGFADGILFVQRDGEGETVTGRIAASETDLLIPEDKAREVLLILGIQTAAKPQNRLMEGHFGQEKAPNEPGTDAETAAKPQNRLMEGHFADGETKQREKPSQSRETGLWRDISQIMAQRSRKEEYRMNLEELLKEHPELREELEARIEESVKNRVDEAREQGAAQERERIRSLDEIAGQVSAEALREAKYGENLADGPALAFRTLAEGKKMAGEYMAQAVSDSADSGAGQVGIGTPDAGEELTDESDEMASYVNERRGKVYEKAE